LTLACLATACIGTACVGLHLTTIKATNSRPSNVAVYFKVETRSGDPVGGLTAERFKIFEDDNLVSQYESKQTILNPEVAAIHYTMLLVDMSGSVTESGTGETLVQAVSTFTERVEKEQKVALYAFDGSPDLYPIVPFTDQPGNAKAGVQQLATFKPKDPSTNLNGAIVKALDELDNALGKATQPLKFGTLVVFTDGTDRANRVTADAMRQHVSEKPFDVFAIGLGAEIQPQQLKAIGKSGTAMATDKNAIVKAFDDVGAKVDAKTRSFYLLSYCSPARAGKHQVRIQAEFDRDGKSPETGSLESDFDATGFAPGCDPNTPPSFDVTKGDSLAVHPDTGDAGTSDKSDKGHDKRDAHAATRPTAAAPPKLPPPPPPAAAASPPPAPAPAPEPPPPAPAPAPKPAQEFTP
jgi:uncharacterized protein YegL